MLYFNLASRCTSALKVMRLVLGPAARPRKRGRPPGAISWMTVRAPSAASIHSPKAAERQVGREP
eukprot:4718183-Pyramimonas_sp.AAC.1